MNYRHGFHAGNHADCLKHALLVWLLGALARKPAPFAVLDAHAGAGAHALDGPEAARTGEWRDGIGRLLPGGDAPPPDPALRPWLDRVRGLGWPGTYPGSPALIRALLRPGDRLAAVELHEDEHARLRARFGRDDRVAVHRRDAWEALGALTPFPERRGLVMLDPPFEQPGEFARLAGALPPLRRRFRAGVVAAWYPVKHRAPVRAFRDALREGGVRDAVAAELWLREPTDPARLNGSGLLVVNPPFGFEAAAAAILAALLTGLGAGEAGQGWAVERVTPE